jgi:hypothetical protein
MIRTIAVAALGLALASAAPAMPLAPIHQPDAMITQALAGCGPGMTMRNGVCVSRHEIREAGTALSVLSGYN